MKIIKLFIINILMISMFIFIGCENKYVGTDRNSKWTKDIDYLAQTLPKKHKDLFFKTSKENFKKEVDSLKRSVPNMNDDEVKVGIHKIVASLGDAHTDCYIENKKLYPMTVYWFKEGMYVTNTIDKYKNILNCKLIKVNGKDIEEVNKLLIDIIPHENEAQIKNIVPIYLIQPELLHGIKVVDNVDKVILTFEDTQNHSFDVQMESVKPDENIKKSFINSKDKNLKALYMQNYDKNYWYKYLEKDKIVYFKYNKCVEDKNKSFKIFSKELLDFIDSHTVDKLVIDLRDNGGGSSSILDDFIEEIKKRKINEKNKLFVVVGRKTFSSAILNSVDLKNKTNATFIGEPTGGKPNHFGEIKNFSLTNSKMQVSYSTKYFKFSKEDTATFIPDKIIELSIGDYINKKDPILETIVKQQKTER